MPRLILTLDDRELQECSVGIHPVSIGRLPDNVMIIDHPAVSGRHARVYKEGSHYVLEDLKSTNGTFVNDRPIARHALEEGDVILIAKHRVLFTQKGGLGDGLVIDQIAADDSETKENLSAEVPSPRPPLTITEPYTPRTAIPTAQGRIATIRVVSGDTGRSEYVLSAVTTMIGRSDTAQIRLKGWFKPKRAAAIARKGEGFTISPLDGSVAVNGEKISSRRDLASGDLIAVSGVTLEFKLS
jgi:pSer/pThr/pTyr-binding forkhead associated (FHA) protein